LSAQRKPKFDARPTKAEIVSAVGELGILDFFPKEDCEREAVMKLIERMVESKRQLDWLIATMIDRVGKWKGPKEFRGIFCTRFKPADGVEVDCRETVGFTPGELESGSIAKHEELKGLAGGAEALRLDGPAGQELIVASLAKDLDLELATNRRIVTNSPRRRVTEEQFQRTHELLQKLDGGV